MAKLDEIREMAQRERKPKRLPPVEDGDGAPRPGFFGGDARPKAQAGLGIAALADGGEAGFMLMPKKKRLTVELTVSLCFIW
jgi:hypothetical protein